MKIYTPQGSRLIVDGDNLLFRCHYSLPEEERGGAAAGRRFLTALRSYVKACEPQNLSECIVTWDERDGENARRALFPAYKGNRKHNPEAFAALPAIKDALDALGVRQMRPLHLEADDLIYWLAAVRFNGASVVVTTDTDLYQLKRPGVECILYDPMRKSVVGERSIAARWEADGVADGLDFILHKCIKGDHSDNIGGIRGLHFNEGEAKGRRVTAVMRDMLLEGNRIDFDDPRLADTLTTVQAELFKRNSALMLLYGIADNAEETAFYENQLQSPCKAFDAAAFKTAAHAIGMSLRGQSSNWSNAFELGDRRNKMLSSACEAAVENIYSWL